MEPQSRQVVVGHDVRKPSALCAVCMTSYDEDTRYEQIYDQYQEQLSGINLFTADPSDRIDGLHADALIVAFDLPRAYVDVAVKGNVSVPPSLGAFEQPQYWSLLGFDVVDPRTQASVLDMVRRYKVPNAPHTHDCLNLHGLFNNAEEWLKRVPSLEKMVPEHKPLQL
ncbi:hypothetical protein [Massilia sp. 9096]|uniref:hypothetical protein n=1 Tax=Massilia sp. 9096 TaxID=1500894 RepID=UPI0012E06186|nr:hypothetical protein [Massilia sp. 9096]